MQIEFPSIFSLSSFCTLSFYSFLIIYRQLFFLIPSFFAPSHSDSSCSPSTFPCISHSLLFCLSFPFVSKNPTSSPPPTTTFFISLIDQTTFFLSFYSSRKLHFFFTFVFHLLISHFHPSLPPMIRDSIYLIYLPPVIAQQYDSCSPCTLLAKTNLYKWMIK